jgi:hypothetical protein
MPIFPLETFVTIKSYVFGLTKASPGVQGSKLTSAILNLKDDFKQRHQDCLEIPARHIPHMNTIDAWIIRPGGRVTWHPSGDG